MAPNADAPATDPVMVVITRRLRTGREADYKPGCSFLGVATQPPAPGKRECVGVPRLETPVVLRAFERIEFA